MAHMQYMPGDQRLVDQLVFELKSKGIFDKFRKECIADVDTRPAYQNLRQRVESSVSTFLARQKWRPDLNKNQLREKLRKHILDGNYLEQGVERIVDQVVNPKIASVFIPQVEDLVYNYLGIPKKKPATETDTNGEGADLLPIDLETVSPGSVKSNDDKSGDAMVIDEESKPKFENDCSSHMETDKQEIQDAVTNELILSDDSIDKSAIPLPEDEIKLEIPIPENSPSTDDSMLESIMLPKDQIPLPKELPPVTKNDYFKPLEMLSGEDSSSSNSSIIRNMSPLTPVRNFDEDNSCDAQQGFENNDSDKKYPISSFQFSIDKKSPETSQDGIKTEEKKDLTQQFESQVQINSINTPFYSESSNSNNLQIDYESDANSKVIVEKTEENTNDRNDNDKKESKEKDKKTNHKSSHSSRDKSRHSSSRDKKDSKDSKNSSSRDKDKYDKKKDDKKSSHRDRSKDRSEKKDSKESKDSKQRSSSHKSSSNKESNSSSSSKHKSSSSNHKHSSSSKDDKKSKSSSTDKKEDKKEHRSDRSSSKSHRSDKERKSSSRSKEDKDKDKKDKKSIDDHYSASGRNNHGRRSTDRDSNDGNSTSSKGSNAHNSKSTETKVENKSSSKSENTSSGSGSTSPSDKDNINNKENMSEIKAMSAVRIETHLNTPITKSQKHIMPEVVLKKPKFAKNFEEAKKLMKMRQFIDEEQKRMNQEAALLLEFQANVRPSLSQVYSSIPGPELEFVCMKSPPETETHHNVEYDEFKSLQEEMNNPATEEKSNESHIDVTEVIPEDCNVETEIVTICDTEIEIQCTQEESYELEHETVDTNAVVLMETKNNEETKELTDYFEVTVTADDASSTDDGTSIKEVDFEQLKDENALVNNELPLRYFNQQEKYEAEIIQNRYKTFYEKYQKNVLSMQSRLFLANCNSYHKDIFNDVTKNEFKIVIYHRNGHFKTKQIKQIKDVDKEISIPENNSSNSSKIASPMFSPAKSDFSFEFSSDYESRLDNMAHTTTRQQIMEIILGGTLIEGSPSKIVMPKIDICQESSIDFDCLKRKLEVEADNNNEVLSANKIRKMSDSEQISSTTEDESHTPNYSLKTTNVRSKYLGKARRLGLPKPRINAQPNSPSSDKSIENYEQNSKQSPEKINGKIKPSPRNKVQRYDASDLYKPKLHFLSRRNNVN